MGGGLAGAEAGASRCRPHLGPQLGACGFPLVAAEGRTAGDAQSVTSLVASACLPIGLLFVIINY